MKKRKPSFKINPIIMVDIILALVLILGVFISAKILSRDKISEKQTLAETSAEDTEENVQGAAADSESEATADEVEDLTPEETAQASVEKTQVTMMFAGDTLFVDDFLTNYDSSGLSGIISTGLQEALSGADYTVINTDFTFSTTGTQAEKDYVFRAAPDRVSILSELGVDMVNIANTHALDFGAEGLAESNAALDGAGVAHIGAGSNLEEAKAVSQVELGGHKIGVIGVASILPAASWAATDQSAGVFSASDTAAVADQIKTAKSQNDLVVAYMNWGNEKENAQSADQIALAHTLIDAGADLVVGSHSHVLQGIEYYNDKPIVYSLGNFLYGTNAYSGILLKAVIGADDSVSLQVVPVKGGEATAWVVDSPAEMYAVISENSSGYYVDENGNITAGENPYPSSSSYSDYDDSDYDSSDYDSSDYDDSDYDSSDYDESDYDDSDYDDSDYDESN